MAQQVLFTPFDVAGPIDAIRCPDQAVRDARDLRWSEMMAAAQKGDGKAYDALLRECLPIIRAVCRARLQSNDELEDAVQDTLLTIHRVRHTYDLCRPFKPWVSAIAERRAIDRRRSSVGRAMSRADLGEADDLPANGASPESNASVREAAKALRAAIATLPEAQRTALSLSKLEGLSLMDASLRSGMSISALKGATHRAIATLRRRLGVSEGA